MGGCTAMVRARSTLRFVSSLGVGLAPPATRRSTHTGALKERYPPSHVPSEPASIPARLCVARETRACYAMLRGSDRV